MSRIVALITGFVLGWFFGTILGQWVWNKFIEFITERMTNVFATLL